VALYGPTDPRIWGPWPRGGLDRPWDEAGTIQHRDNVWLEQKPLPCLPCQLESCARRLDSRSQCLDELSAAHVVTAVDHALASRCAASMPRSTRTTLKPRPFSLPAVVSSIESTETLSRSRPASTGVVSSSSSRPQAGTPSVTRHASTAAGSAAGKAPTSSGTRSSGTRSSSPSGWSAPVARARAVGLVPA